MNTKLNAVALFPGGGGVEVAWRALGLNVLHSFEINAEVAKVAQENGFDTRHGDVLNEPLPDYGRVDILHASPPCPSFSKAKTNAAETGMDILLAERVCDYIEQFLPHIFTLENVWGYRKSISWTMIRECLARQGYGIRRKHICMADFGIQQTRKRMIVVAVRDELFVTMPRQTHAKRSKIIETPLFPSPVKPWVSWYEAIDDLLPGCPDSQLANWQLRRMEKPFMTMLVGAGGFEGVVTSSMNEPSPTVTANQNQGSSIRVVLVGAGGFRGEVVTSSIDEPAPTVTANQNQGTQLRAVLLDSENAGQQWGKGYRNGNEPVHTIHCAGPGRAVLIDGKLSGNGERITTCDGQQPAMTITTSHNYRDLKAFTGLRTVQLTTRCLARFQSLPDSYQLPEKKRLACLVIGNMMHPRFTEQLYTHLLSKYIHDTCRKSHEQPHT